MAEIALSAAVSAMNSAMENIRVRVNNISNVNSLGYKSMEVETKDLFYNNVKKAGVIETEGASPRPVGVQVGIGSKVSGTYRNLSVGEIKQTNRPLDIAILGSGYIAVMLPNGNRAYTRAGAFQVDPDGNIVTSDGYAFENNINISDYIEDSISVSSTGLITGTPKAGGEQEEIGQLQIYTFPNENGLELVGKSYLIETNASGEGVASNPGENGAGKIGNGMLEISNVSIADEYASFMAAQLAYQMSSRVMQSVDEMLKSTNK